MFNNKNHLCGGGFLFYAQSRETLRSGKLRITNFKLGITNRL